MRKQAIAYVVCLIVYIAASEILVEELPNSESNGVEENDPNQATGSDEVVTAEDKQGKTHLVDGIPATLGSGFSGPDEDDAPAPRDKKPIETDEGDKIDGWKNYKSAILKGADVEKPEFKHSDKDEKAKDDILRVKADEAANEGDDDDDDDSAGDGAGGEDPNVASINKKSDDESPQRRIAQGESITDEAAREAMQELNKPLDAAEDKLVHDGKYDSITDVKPTQSDEDGDGDGDRDELVPEM